MNRWQEYFDGSFQKPFFGLINAIFERVQQLPEPNRNRMPGAYNTFFKNCTLEDLFHMAYLGESLLEPVQDTILSENTSVFDNIDRMISGLIVSDDGVFPSEIQQTTTYNMGAYSKADGTFYSSLSGLALSTTQADLIKINKQVLSGLSTSGYIFTQLSDMNQLISSWLDQRITMINSLKYVSYDFSNPYKDQKEIGSNALNVLVHSYSEGYSGTTPQEAYNEGINAYQQAGLTGEIKNGFYTYGQAFDVYEVAISKHKEDDYVYYTNDWFNQISEIKPNFNYWFYADGQRPAPTIPNSGYLTLSAFIPQGYDYFEFNNLSNNTIPVIQQGNNKLDLQVNNVTGEKYFAKWTHGNANLPLSFSRRNGGLWV